ncbi:YbaB/EbfC family nucleoid-associated protein [Kribbella italica]|uniref:DNA-binding protein YbaB n=1 Tax=Kribbella italica TaxID=1540520 RepID=A0A7W9MXG6_9ACTN|nr:YbaB/EbfC family nucleoid-associated protein [Kribbella italica]MBB5840106.1 DNA-binding protein YbaB [Kribbella italica]
MVSRDDRTAGQSLLGQLEEADRKLREYRSISNDTEGTAQSPDGLIEATVGLYGEVRELVLDPRIYRTVDATALAEAVRDVINKAVGEAQATAAGQLSSLLPGGLSEPSDLAFAPLDAELRKARRGGLS